MSYSKRNNPKDWTPLKISGMDVVISKNGLDCGQQPIRISAGLAKFNKQTCWAKD